ncbi:MAG: hypothetical protein ABSG26_00065 [Bryobacteraceae bacterium]
MFFLDVFKTGVEDLFDAAEFGAPEFAHVVEAPVYGGFECGDPGVYHGAEQ